MSVLDPDVRTLSGYAGIRCFRDRKIEEGLYYGFKGDITPQPQLITVLSGHGIIIDLIIFGMQVTLNYTGLIQSSIITITRTVIIQFKWNFIYLHCL